MPAGMPQKPLRESLVVMVTARSPSGDTGIFMQSRHKTTHSMGISCDIMRCMGYIVNNMTWVCHGLSKKQGYGILENGPFLGKTFMINHA